eukprot:Amastigsp_a509810_39.p3 type:complete len:124 gc:universal Amastigsp_a509810_39:574-203(-)
MITSGAPLSSAAAVVPENATPAPRIESARRSSGREQLGGGPTGTAIGPAMQVTGIRWFSSRSRSASGLLRAPTKKSHRNAACSSAGDSPIALPTVLSPLSSARRCFLSLRFDRFASAPAPSSP